jgi:thioredoxin-dependent peroxiredoxin
MLREGDPAPDIRVQSDQDQPFDLASLRGKKVVLYFFPKANTSG